MNDSLKDRGIGIVTVKNGKDLETMSNMLNPRMLDAIEENTIIGGVFNIRYCAERKDQLLRFTVGYKGRGRDDIVKICTSSEDEEGMQTSMAGMARDGVTPGDMDGTD